MKIGSQEAPKSAISASNADVVVVRGYDLVADLIGKISFTEHAWLLIAGSLPSEAQRRILDATLVAIAEHGIVPSVAAARMTYAASPEALQGAVAAGLLGSGSVILGASEAAGRLLDEVVKAAAGGSLASAAHTIVGRYRTEKRAIPGFGHPLHKGSDPRATRLFALAEEAGVSGVHVEAVREVDAAIREIVGRTLAVNVSGAIPAVLLDAGYPLLALRGVPLLARTASLIGHLLEEQQRPIGFALADQGSSAVTYDGPSPIGFVADKNLGMVMNSVLAGVRVIEQGTFITGPCAGMMLADLGADVIKIETAGTGDPYRSFKTGYYSAHFQAYNRNKRAIGVNLKEAADRKLFHELIGGADVYIQNFRPGAAARLGADFDTLSAINPRLIYCSISGFGQDGPYAQRPVYDSVAQAVSGFLGVAIDPENPRFIGPALADAITGIYASLGISAALVERGRTGKGKYIEISMLETMMHFAIEPFMGYFALGEEPSGKDRPRLAQAFIARCKDGKLCAFHLSSLEKFWTALVDALEAPELNQNPLFSTRLDRIDNYEALDKALNAIFATRNRADWVERLASFDVPFAPINSIPDVVNDPQAQHLGMIVPVAGRGEGALQSVRPPFSFDGEHALEVIAAPLLDQHGAQIRSALDEAPGKWPERQESVPVAAGEPA